MDKLSRPFDKQVLLKKKIWRGNRRPKKATPIKKIKYYAKSNALNNASFRVKNKLNNIFLELPVTR